MNNIIKGNCEATSELKKLVEMVSISNSTVLLRGETGCGKDVVARAIHQTSKREGELVNVNCAAIPSELLESELFGHEKGAFTGADNRREGRFEASDQGTLFLDEIGDMPLPLQAKLLRAIETRTIQRVGGKSEIKLDLRLICATHQNIEKKIDEGLFRADLFYRINVFPIEIPTLAERKEDIPILVTHILKEIRENGFEKTAQKFSISSTSKNYGNIGWINAESLNSKVSKVLKNLKKGEVSKPIKIMNSFIFFKLLDRRVSKINEINTEEFKKRLIDQKKNELFNLYSRSHLSKLKNNSLIEYK